ncbi:sigma-70 family RNA polymerase sigma factor [Streptosporangium sp. NPDC049078]|uniref:RNA polymerase sigma factor n=1 Tax=Streptosporangium sp. NPDC049078 TaxID=3155767 RepID=UPI00343853C8
MNSPEERFAALFEETHQPLLAYAARRVTDPADAADVLTETFLVAWRRLEEVPEGEQARPWLFGVARKVLANLYRGERRRHALAEKLRSHIPEVAPPPDTVISPVEAAMSRLGDDDQELLRLLAWEELTRDEIALALGVSRATVRVRLHRARGRLAKELQAQETAGRVSLHRAAAQRTSDVLVAKGRARVRSAVKEQR